MQHLYEFTDFDVFKKAMIERKKATSATASTNDSDEGRIELDEGFFDQMRAENHLDTASGWAKSTDFADDSLGVSGTVYEKKFDGYPLKWTRCDATFKDATTKDFEIFMK